MVAEPPAGSEKIPCKNEKADLWEATGARRRRRKRRSERRKEEGIREDKEKGEWMQRRCKL